MAVLRILAVFDALLVSARVLPLRPMRGRSPELRPGWMANMLLEQG
jgi:hypothetical protein